MNGKLSMQRLNDDSETMVIEVENKRGGGESFRSSSLHVLSSVLVLLRYIIIIITILNLRNQLDRGNIIKKGGSN